MNDVKANEEEDAAAQVAAARRYLRENGLLPETPDDTIPEEAPTIRRKIARKKTVLERIVELVWERPMEWVQERPRLMKWVLTPIYKLLAFILSILWTIFGPFVTFLLSLLFLLGIVILVFGWSFIAYQIAWYVADETASRIALLLFLVIAPIFGIASKFSWAWLTPEQQAHAEYTADLVREKKDT